MKPDQGPQRYPTSGYIHPSELAPSQGPSTLGRLKRRNPPGMFTAEVLTSSTRSRCSDSRHGEEGSLMTMKMDLIWQDDGEIEYRASCADCSYQSGPFDDEETARAAWFGHACVRSGTPVSV